MPYLARFLPKTQPERPQPAPLAAAPAACAGEVLLQVEGAERRFGGLIAVNKGLRSMSAPGEILGLIGPNGAGKSTMFNLLTGALACNSGKIVFAGRNIERLSQAKIARAGIARTFRM